MPRIRTGLEWQNRGAKKTLEEIKKINKRLRETATEMRNVEKATTSASGKFGASVKRWDRELKKATSSSGKFGNIFKSLSKDSGRFAEDVLDNIPGLRSFNSTLAGVIPTAGSAALAVGAVAAAVVGLTAAAKRGAQVELTARAFTNIVGGADEARTALFNAREATRGLVSDFEIFQLTTLALQGTSQQFRNVVAKDIGVVIDASNRIAQATGQSAEEVRRKFFLGLRRESKLLVDDLGVTITDLDAQFQALPESIRAGIDPLDSQAKFAAVSIAQLNENVKELGESSTVLDAFARAASLVRNVIDLISAAIQPLVGPIAGRLIEIFGFLESVFRIIAVAINTVAKVIGGLIQAFFIVQNAILGAIGGALEPLKNILIVLAALGQIFADTFVAAITWLANQVAAGIGFIVGLFESLFGDIDLSLSALAFNLGKGGALVIGSFAAGMLTGGTFVVRAVNAIAQIVADFLQGFSPPKRGPLSKIDKGGKNVALAWVEGFAGGFDKVSDVVAQVNGRLGAIGSLTLPQVDARLKQLDSAIAPFQERVAIVEADLQAITGGAQDAIDAVERQQKAVLEAFQRGEVGAEQVRAFDRQLDFLKSRQRLSQGVVDNAKIQLGIAQAQQAQERALLNIQKQRLQTTETTARAGSRAAKPRAAKPRAAKPPAGGEAPLGGAGGGFTPGEGISILDDPRIREAGEQLGSGFEEGLEQSGFNEALGAFNESTGDLQANIQRIATSDPVQSLTERFSGLSESIGGAFDNVRETITNKLERISFLVRTTFNTLFDPTNPDSVINTILRGAIGIDLSVIGEKFSNLISEEGPLGLFVSFFSGLFGDDGHFALWFGSGGILPTAITGFADTVTRETGVIAAALRRVFTNESSPLQRIIGAVSGVVETVVGLFTSLSGGVTSGLLTLVGGLQRILINPFVDAVNGLLGLFESTVNFLVDAYNDSIVAEVFGSIDRFSVGRVSAPQLSIPSLGGGVGGGGGSGAVSGSVTGVSFNAGGALGFRGLSVVGERGPELVNFRRPADIFPNSVSRAMASAFGSVSGGMNIANGGASRVTNSTSNSNVTNNNINLRDRRDMNIVRREMEMGLLS